MKTKNIIRDGATRDGYVEPVDRLHQGLIFKYRMMIPEQVDALEEAIRATTAEKGSQLVSVAMAKHVTEWSEVDEKDQPVKVDFDSFRRLPISLQARVIFIVCGKQSSDAYSIEQKPPMGYADELNAALEGKTGNQRMMETTEKN